jgi:hypothetical protein
MPTFVNPSYATYEAGHMRHTANESRPHTSNPSVMGYDLGKTKRAHVSCIWSLALSTLLTNKSIIANWGSACQ